MTYQTGPPNYEIKNSEPQNFGGAFTGRMRVRLQNFNISFNKE